MIFTCLVKVSLILALNCLSVSRPDVNEIGFEQTAYTVLESAGDVMIRVRLTDIDLAQTNDDTLGVLIMGSASTLDGSAVGKRVDRVHDIISAILHCLL